MSQLSSICIWHSGPRVSRVFNLYWIRNVARKIETSSDHGMLIWNSFSRHYINCHHWKKTIWRGIHGTVSDLYDQDFICWGVSSCRETMNTIEKCIGCSAVRTIFMVECINGNADSAHSFHRNENEIILMPGTYLRVINKWSPADNLYMIHLQEETPLYQLVALPFTPLAPVEITPVDELRISTSDRPSGRTAVAQPEGKSFDILS